MTLFYRDLSGKTYCCYFRPKDFLLLCLCSILSTSLKTRLRLEIHFGVIIHFPEGFIYLEGSIDYEGEFYLVCLSGFVCAFCSVLWRNLRPCLLTLTLACASCVGSISGFTSPMAVASFSRLQGRHGARDRQRERYVGEVLRRTGDCLRGCLQALEDSLLSRGGLDEWEFLIWAAFL